MKNSERYMSTQTKIAPVSQSKIRSRTCGKIADSSSHEFDFYTGRSTANNENNRTTPQQNKKTNIIQQ